LLWFAAVAVWFGTLWWLSSQSNPKPPGPEFQFKDKFLHFGYFFVGGVVATSFFQRLKPEWPRERAALCAVFICMLTGAVDEWHQTQVPERSGNDAADLTADFTGGFCGAVVAGSVLRRLAGRA
jgi:VanZ family protein